VSEPGGGSRGKGWRVPDQWLDLPYSKGKEKTKKDRHHSVGGN